MTKRREVTPHVKGNHLNAVVLHGMFSGAGSMWALSKAIEARNHYRTVVRFDIPTWKHRLAPQILAEQNAAALTMRIERSMRKGTLKAPFDLIGHSNGGYVALFLARDLGSSIVRAVYTLGTPRGLPRDYAVPAGILDNVCHLRGGVDGVPFGGDHSPGDGRWTITFPDEGHCSLHAGADTNGVADIICFLAGMDHPSIFVDDSGTIHPWVFCSTEVERARFRLLGPSRELRVCDGVHDAALDSLRAARKVVTTTSSTLGRVAIYIAIRSRLKARQATLDVEYAQLRAYGRVATRELAALRSENDDLRERIARFDRKARAIAKAFKAECQADLVELTDAMSACEAIATGPSFGNREMAEVNGLLRVALEHHASLNQRIQKRPQLRIGGRSD